MMRTRKRIGAALLASALLLGQLGATAYAEGPPQAGGLCQHHSAHDADCGYVEAIPGHDCGHEHRPDCYTGPLVCGREEDGEPTATGSDAGHRHTDDCYALDCPHERGEHKEDEAQENGEGGLGGDAACGYIEAVEGRLCGYVCAQCGGDSETIKGNNPPAQVGTRPGTEAPKDSGGGGGIVITSFDQLSGRVKVQSLPLGAGEREVNLPASVGAWGYTVGQDAEPVPEELTVTGVKWELTGENNTPTEYEEGRTSSCSYYFRLVLPEGYRLEDNGVLPEIEVRYGWATRANASRYQDDDVRAFQAILDAHPTLKSIPGVDETDPGSWQTAGLVKWNTDTDKRIITLDLSDKGLRGRLDVSGLPKLRVFMCHENPDLTELKLGQQDNLTTLHCYNTGMRGELDVSGFFNLQILNCGGNLGLTELKLGTHNDLTTLHCYGMGIRGKLDVSGFSKLTTLNCYNNPGLTELKLGQNNDLTTLNCSRTGITGRLDVSGFSKLTLLNCYANPDLTELKLGQNNDLTTLNCSRTGITGRLDVSGCTKLTVLKCYSTGMRGKLDVSGCSKLKTLDCNNNPDLTELKLGQHDDLTDLYCNGTGMRGILDVSGCSKLKSFDCYDNPGLTELKLGQQDDLPALFCNNTGMRGILDVSGCSKLEILSCYGNPDLTELKLGQQDDLTTLYCNNTGVRGILDVSGCSKLKILECYNTPDLTELKLGQQDDLTDLLCNKTGMKGILDVSGCSKLKTLWCSDNPGLTDLKLGQQNDLTELLCNNTGMRGMLDVSGFSNLQTLMCDGTSIQLKDGVVRAETGGKVMVLFGDIPNLSTTTIPFTLRALPDGGYDFTGWAGLPDAGKSRDNPVSFTPGTGYAYTASFTKNTGGSGGSSGSYNFTTPQPPKPNTPVLAVIQLPLAVEGDTAFGRTDDGSAASAIAEAGRDAKAGTNGIALQYDAQTSNVYDGFSIVIERATLDRLLAARVKFLALNTSIVDLTFDLAALQEIAAKSTGDVTIAATRETGAAGDMLAAVGARPVYRLTVSYPGADGKAAAIQNFGPGRVAVGLAYTPAATEQEGGLYLVYSADGNSAEWFFPSGYNGNSGNVMGSVAHFSLYGVGYRPGPAFTDTANHWAKGDIDFVASRGLMTGTGDAAFTPEGAMTRGVLVTALGRLAGIDPAAYPSSGRFTDVPADAHYAPYVEWAAGKGIVSEAGEKRFGPEEAVTREQLAAIMERYAGEQGYVLPVAREWERFADEGEISDSMKGAVQAMQQAGVMSGVSQGALSSEGEEILHEGGRRFGPKDTATRAQTAAVLRRFVEIAINPAAGGGWGQNEAGKWLYYEDAKAVTGWKQIDGAWRYFDGAGLMEAGGWRQIGEDWYYFYPDGTMAHSTTIDGRQIGPDGRRIQ